MFVSYDNGISNLITVLLDHYPEHLGIHLSPVEKLHNCTVVLKPRRFFFVFFFFSVFVFIANFVKTGQSL